MSLLQSEDVVFRKFLPNIRSIEKTPVIINEWDVSSTIRDLSYLTHSHYRYYGKFPSAVAGQILEQLPPPSSKHYMLDNFCGSGTSLVEAKLRGIHSYGVDISWLSVLASNVKVFDIDIDKILEQFDALVLWVEKNRDTFSAPDDPFCNKWFEDTAAKDLNGIRTYLLDLEQSKIKDFLLIAFIAIVRRVSKAYDAEVRPHVNKNKKQRDVLSAFSKKVRDMCKDHRDFMLIADEDTQSKAVLSDNLNLPDEFNDGLCYLVISHPPYLNSFNYAPVFSLEFYWGGPFESYYTNDSNKLYKTEMRAHPANEKVTEQYFEHLRECYTETFKIQSSGSYLAIVIGDCTRHKKLVPVIDNTISIVESIGYKLKEVNYRTTHYGLGKYAYKHRADYHGDSEQKKDAIIIFKK